MIAKIRYFAKTTVPTFLGHPLWEGKRFSPFLRFAQLQLSYALGRHGSPQRWINGLALPLHRGDNGLTGNFYLGLHEFDTMAFTIHLLGAGDLFLDIGANLGSYSLLASGVCGARSIAFEPVPTTAKRLGKIIAINKLDHLIDARQLAITSPANANQPLLFSTDQGCMNAFVDSSYPGSTTTTAVSTLDLQCQGLAPTLLKIDVEGYENDLLQGARQTLTQPSVLAVIIEGQTLAVNRQFQELGFEDIQYDALQRRIQPHQRHSANRIWIRSDQRQSIQARLERAPRREVYCRPF
jgi:FkbM family methyltransferase